MKVLILILIGIILFKLLNNPECFNIGIQNTSKKKIYISKTLSLQDCNSNPIPSCSDTLLIHDSNCYRLLNKNDNLWLFDINHPLKGRNILLEIINNETKEIEHTILRASGKLEDLNENSETISSILVTNTILSILVSLIENEENEELEYFPIPKFLISDDMKTFVIIGLTAINNNNKEYADTYFKGGGIIHRLNDNEHEHIVYAFYEDFVFNNMEYRNAKFENNEEGYNGYILEDKIDYSDKDFLIKHPDPDVTIKFYIEDI
jgi:hypothetical protein